MRADGAAEGSSRADTGTDSLHILPLGMLPLATSGLKRARLVKTVRLNSAVELFHDGSAGSGLVEIDDIPGCFAAEPQALSQDLKILRRAGSVTSFDVYSLRIGLRNLGIPVEDQSQLALSERKQQELAGYMQEFTRPLIHHVYGNQAKRIASMADLNAMLSTPDRTETLANLRRISERLGLPLADIPAFLADYGDMFLSISYFRSCADGAQEVLEPFLAWLTELRGLMGVREDMAAQRMIGTIEMELRRASTGLEDCFHQFALGTSRFWDALSPEAFRQLQALVSTHHTSLGALCCALAVKLDSWRAAFPDGGGTAGRRMDWLRQEMTPGLGAIKAAISSPTNG